MYRESVERWQHAHVFGQDEKKQGESRTLFVIVLTSAMMVLEIVAGLHFGSMALLADGLHMASHAAALGISAFAYVYARRHAHDERFSFGTGKVNALGGFTGAILLSFFTLFMVWESVERVLNPVSIAFNQAILVAVLGLLVNGISVWILGLHSHDHGHSHDHSHDHNLRSAYLHVLADALTSFTAIFALLAAKYFGLVWMDPLMGIVGALMVARWSLGLLKSTGDVLLDRQGPEEMRTQIRDQIEGDESDVRIVDLHLWSIGPDIYAAIISIVADRPLTADQCRSRLDMGDTLVHVTIETNLRSDELQLTE
ncbi:MAG: cation transporter [Gemmatimonadetes bacterium]|nr:cation transporter [Gemmatimonadota bacterium]|tara:strand:- start:953 stop:1888 length:936 start_codon:yes stop_codon:yes gene_type:complete